MPILPSVVTNNLDEYNPSPPTASIILDTAQVCPTPIPANCVSFSFTLILRKVDTPVLVLTLPVKFPVTLPVKLPDNDDPVIDPTADIFSPTNKLLMTVAIPATCNFSLGLVSPIPRLPPLLNDIIGPFNPKCHWKNGRLDSIFN